jgi:DNA repair protein RecO (recombination protein O)
MLIRSRALVLSRLKYNDTSDIACLFTEALGAVSFVVRISKKRRAGDKSILFQPLNLLEIEWDHQENSSLSHIRDAWCYYPYSDLTSDPVKITIASFLSEFLYYALRDEREDEKLYNYLALSLQWLDAAEHGFSNFHIAFQVQVSRFLGIPQISPSIAPKEYTICKTPATPIRCPFTTTTYRVRRQTLSRT